MAENITISITNGAGFLLSQALSFADWSSDAGEKYRAGEMIENELGFTLDRPTTEGEFQTWQILPKSILLTARKLAVGKKCLAATLGRLPCGKPLNSLIVAFGLKPDEGSP